MAVQKKAAAVTKPGAAKHAASSTAIVKQERNTALVSTKVPEYLQSYRGNHSGLEGSDASDFIIPRLGLCQSLTPQRVKGNPKYIQGLEEGQFFNTVTGEIYGEEVEFIPLYMAKTRLKFNKPIGSGIDCASSISPEGVMFGKHSPAGAGGCAVCQFAQFKDEPDEKGSSAPDCTDFKGWVSLIDGQPIGISVKSTSLTVMKQFNSMIRLANMPAFVHRCKASSTTQTKNGNTFQQWVLTKVGFTPEDFIGQAQDFFTALKSRGVRIDTDGVEEEGDASFSTQEM